MKYIVGLILILCAVPAHATPCSNTSLGSGIVCIQSASGTATSAGSISKAFVSNNTAGSLITVSLGITGPTVNYVVTCADTQGNLYVVTAFLQGSTGSTEAIFCYAENVKAGANTVTASITESKNFNMAIAEYSGLATSGSYDQSNINEGSINTPPGTINSGDIVTGAATELLFSFGYDGANTTDTFSASAGFTERENNGTIVTYDQVVTSTGTYSNTVTISNNSTNTFHVAIIGFKTTNSTIRNCTNSIVGGGVTCIQAVSGNSVLSTTATASYTNTAGHFLLYICAVQTNSPSPVLSDSNGNTITALDSVSNIGEAIWAIVFNSHSGANTVTCTNGVTAVGMIVVAAEYSGIININPIDQFTTANSGGTRETSQAVGSITTTGNGRLIISMVYNPDNPSTYLPSSGFAPEYTNLNLNTGRPMSVTFGDAIEASMGTYSTTWSGSGGRLMAMISGIISKPSGGSRHFVSEY